jgi:hypothetical protein
MLRFGVLFLGLLLASGCHRHHHAMCAVAMPRANLLLSNDPEPIMLALNIPRSDWPAVEHGFRTDDTVSYTHVLADTQYWFDDFGALVDDAVTVETGTWYR